MSAADSIGSIGVALLLVGFFLNLFGYLDRSARPYHVVNALGAGLACYASWLIGFVPFVVLEGAWATVAVIALLRPPSAEAA